MSHVFRFTHRYPGYYVKTVELCWELNSSLKNQQAFCGGIRILMSKRNQKLILIDTQILVKILYLNRSTIQVQSKVLITANQSSL